MLLSATPELEGESPRWSRRIRLTGRLSVINVILTLIKLARIKYLLIKLIVDLPVDNQWDDFKPRNPTGSRRMINAVTVRVKTCNIVAGIGTSGSFKQIPSGGVCILLPFRGNTRQLDKTGMMQNQCITIQRLRRCAY